MAKISPPLNLDYLFPARIQLQTNPDIFRPELFFPPSVLGLFIFQSVFSSLLIPGWFFLTMILNRSPDPGPAAPSTTEKVHPCFPIFPQIWCSGEHWEIPTSIPWAAHMDRQDGPGFFSRKRRGFSFPGPGFHPQNIPLEEKELMELQDPTRQIHDQWNSIWRWLIIKLI